MSLDELARDSGAEVRDQTASIEPPKAGVIVRRSRRGRMVTGVAAVALLVLAGVGLAMALHDDSEPTGLQITDDPGLQGMLPANGWVAFSAFEGQGRLGDGDVYLVREGAAPRRIAGTDTDTSTQDCPAFSPDGARLVYGQMTLVDRNAFEDDGELVIVEVTADGSTSGRTTIAVEGLTSPPCGFVWSSDGRWLAFAVEDEVRLVDTATEAQRRLPGRSATDLEWVPGTEELAIADDGIDLYSVSSDEARSLGLDGAGAFTWSPDGTRVAFTRLPSGGETSDVNTSIWVANADGTDERQLDDYRVLQGNGPVWSPDGHSIAYNRTTGFGEPSEVVVIGVDDGDPTATETVINYPTTPGPDGEMSWSNPRSVTWSPDGSTLLYVVWGNGSYGLSSASCDDDVRSLFAGLLAVPLDTTAPPFLLADPSCRVGDASWGRQSE